MKEIMNNQIKEIGYDTQLNHYYIGKRENHHQIIYDVLTDDLDIVKTFLSLGYKLVSKKEDDNLDFPYPELIDKYSKIFYEVNTTTEYSDHSRFGFAIKEIKAGKKTSHWMWYIFPQIAGLGFSMMSMKYSIKNLDEAKEYLKYYSKYYKYALDNLLDKELNSFFSNPIDIIKLKSSLTLFSMIDSSYKKYLDHFFNGECDQKTLEIINLEKESRKF